MKKANSSLFEIVAVCFIIVSVVCFAIPGNRSGAFWLLYGVMAAMFLILLYAVSAAGKHLDRKNGFLSFTPIKTGLTCLTLQTALLFVYLLVPAIPTWLCIVASVILLGMVLISVFAVGGSKAYIDKVDENIQSKTQFIQSLKTEATVLLNSEKDPAVKKELAALVEKIRLSDPMSANGLEEIEKKIVAKFTELVAASNKQSVISEIKELLEERNTRCKALK